ncbi:aldehyde dehydrogenase [Aspergillus sclerotiicarbonarius CBS 121057]|uniref:aldehyde dehydrogenase (NAD(+)) n=1 Tax=Aspergillus sclerotiicarbonarius (strain CBS 121057 / IBT 28362) TaxID=1448318 RepID=A0A319FDW8_ASPSB|nr:aldehyde dehydrogenase [Aspergillus sclerotiicarbonarius CBS 121057]
MAQLVTERPGKPEVIENRLYINGQFVPSQSGSTFDIYNPATEAHSASVYEAGPEDVDLAVAAAKAAFPAWSDLNALQRAHHLEKWANALEKCAPELAYLDAICMGKPINSDFFGSLAPTMVRVFASKALDILGDTSLNTPNFMNMTLRQPYGVCGAIIPWNGPVPTMIMKVGAALITGNTIVVKTSEKAPLSCLLAARCAQEAGLPPGVLNILSGYGRPCGEAIARHMDIRKLSFTGSTATGKLIQRMAAESNLKSVDLELGGKSPLIIWDDADLSKAVPAAAQSILANSGQVCIASSRVYVHAAIAQQFIDLLTTTMREMGKSGDPLDPSTMRGPQADAAQFERVQGYLQLAREEGVEIHLGGGREGSQGYFIEPTLLSNVPESSKLVKEEIFGPVLVVNTFTDEEEVMTRANDTEYGLYASVYTRDMSRALRAAKRFEAGSVCVNCTSPMMAFDMPFGGWKGSGQGQELSRYAMDCWTQLKSVFIAL